ncbi:MAG: hypothetical protein KAX49_17860 [Halanaerobiales bacterium]|nr:hypothetical protein [Halanaerobiales bacterium]
MQIKQVILQFEISEELPKNYGHYLRGYVGNLFSESLFHNHLDDDKFRYAYPLIQYKIIDKKPTVIGLGAGTTLVNKHFLDLDKLVLGDKVFEDFERKMKIDTVDLSFASTMNYCYEFLTPWMALNQKNYRLYKDKQKNLDSFDEKVFFQKILVGNILSFAKAIDWWVNSQIFVLPEIKSTKIQFKGQQMLGFVGKFYSNLVLPDLIGLGNSPARGFGTIRKVKS